MEIFVQFWALIAFLLMVLGWWQKKKANIISCHIGATICYSLHYLLLGATTGFFINLIGIFRMLIIFKKENKKNSVFNNVIWLYILIILYAFTTAITWDGFSSIFSSFASILYTLLIYKSSPPVMRKGQILVSASLINYNNLVESYMGIITEALILLSVLLAIVKQDLKITDDTKQHSQHTIMNKIYTKFNILQKPRTL